MREKNIANTELEKMRLASEVGHVRKSVIIYNHRFYFLGFLFGSGFLFSYLATMQQIPHQPIYKPGSDRVDNS